MKEIIFLRHAKSDWGNEQLQDIDRHLNERGYTDAYFLAKWFSENKSKPDRFLSSTATRALSTALIFARTMEYDMQRFRLDPNLYECPLTRLFRIIHAQDNDLSSLMIAGHNPCMTEVCNEVSSDHYFENVPTCGIVSFRFNVSKWSEVGRKNGELLFHQFPKNFKQD